MDHKVVPVRLVTQRLSSTPVWQLPHIAPFLAGTIGKSGSLLSTPNTKLNPDINVLMHKLKTQISSLLQDKNPQARWAAVILVKATIEAGDHEILQGAGAWARSIVMILGKPDPPSMKRLCMITLTRIFLLTQGHQSLVREITTPVLPAFITACLKALSSNVDEGLSLVSVQALVQLLPHHPSSFRPFVAQIRTSILPLLATTPTTLGKEGPKKQWDTPADVANSSRRLYVLLSTCAPKKTENEEWLKSLRLVVDTSHATADRVFRSLVEDRRTSFNSLEDVTRASSERVQSGGEDLLGLPNWVGIDAGIERLKGLLSLLKAFISTSTQFAVTVPIGIILCLANRILSLLVPANVSQGSARINQEFRRDEREPLLLGLPRVHALAIDVLSSVTERLGPGGVSLYTNTLQQCLWALNVDGADDVVRAAVYKYMKQFLIRFGLSVPHRFKEALSECAKLCCEDLLPSQKTNSDDLKDSQKSLDGPSQTNGYDCSRLSSREWPLGEREAQLGAEELLPLINTYLPEDYLTKSIQAHIDRTAILTQHNEGLLASILQRSDVAATSILPFLARAFPDSNSTEALIRPRMPIVQTISNSPGSQVNDNSDTYVQESSYAQIYSGNAITDNTNTMERKSFVEDSLQSDRQLPQLSFASTSVEPALPVENNTQRTEVSLVEVPETQPITVMSSNKRDRDATSVEQAPSQHLRVTALDPTANAEEVPVPKRPRIGDWKAAPKENVDGVDESAQSEPVELVDAPPAELTIPVQAIKPARPIENDSDSDDSSIHIDPTLDTEDEDEDEDANQ